MDFLTLGNLLTLGLVGVALVVYRYLDRGNRSLDLVRDYAEKLKDELRGFVTQQEEAVQDYAVQLGVEKDSAKILMDRIRQSDQALAAKAAEIAGLKARVDAYEQRVNACGKSMDDLAVMADRVQENLNRLREESVFVEGVAGQMAQARTALTALEKDLTGLETRFERENAGALEKIAGGLTASVRSAIADLEARADTVERVVEDHREVILRAGADQEARIERDLARVEDALGKALERAAVSADAAEAAALEKLQARSLERIAGYQVVEEERLKAYQEGAKARVAEAQGLLKNFREDVEKTLKDWESRERVFQEERWAERQDVEVKDRSLQEARLRDIDALGTRTAEVESRIAAGTAALERRFEELRERTEDALAGQESLVLKASENMRQKALEDTEAELRRYQEARAGEWKRLEALAEDARRLDEELRREFAATTAQAREEFERVTAEAIRSREALAAEFGVTVAELQAAVAGARGELDGLRERAGTLAAEHLRSLEDAFTLNVAERSGELERRLEEWQGAMDARFAALEGALGDKRLGLEGRVAEWQAAMNGQFALLDAALEERRRETEAQAAAWQSTLEGRWAALETSVAEGKTQAEARVAGWKSALEGQLAALDGDAEEKRQAAEARLEEWRGALDARFAALESALGDKRLELDARAAEWRAALDGQFTILGEAVEEGRRQAEESLAEWRASLDSRVVTLDGEAEEKRRAAEARIDAWQDVLDKRLEAMEGVLGDKRFDVDARAAEWQALMTNQFAALDAALEERRREAEGQVAAWQSALEGRLALLDGDAEEKREAAEARIAAEQSALDEHMKALDAALEDKRLDLEARTAGWQTMLDGQFTILGAAVEEGRKGAEERLAAWRTGLESQLAVLDGDAEEKRRAAEARIAAWQSALDERLGGLETAFAEARKGVEDRLSLWVAALEGAEKDLADLREKAGELESEKFQALEESLTAEADRRKREMEDRLSAWRSSLEDQLRLLEGGAEERRQALEERLAAWRQGTEEDLAVQEKTAEERRQALEERLAAWRQAVDEDLAVQEKAGAERRQALEERLAGEFAAALTAQDAFVTEEIERRRHEVVEAFQEGQAAYEERLRGLAAQAEARNTELERLVAASREEAGGLNGRIAALREDLEKSLAAAAARVEETRDLVREAEDVSREREAQMLKDVEGMKMKILDAAGTKLEEYRAAQEAEWRRLEALAEDSRKLDETLRRELEEASNRAREEFARFEAQAEAARKAAAAEFDASAAELRGGMEKLGGELAELREKAAADLTGAIASLEEDFSQGLRRRGEELNERVAAWQTALEADTRRTIGERGGDVTAALERLAGEARTLEENLAGRITVAEAALVSSEAAFQDSLAKGIDRVRGEAEERFRAALDDHARRAAEDVTRGEAAFEERLRELTLRAETESGGLDRLLAASRENLAGFENEERSLEERFKACAAALEARTAETRDLETSLGELRARLDVLAREAVENQAPALAALVEDLRRKTLEAAGAQLEEYRAAQEAEGRRLEELAGERLRLENELRGDLDAASERAREDLARFEAAATAARTETANKFAALETEVSEALSRQGEETEKRLLAWGAALESRLEKLGNEAEARRQAVEDDYRERLARGLAEARAGVEQHLKAEMEDYARTAAAVARDEVEDHLQAIARVMETSRGELGELLEASRRNIADFDARFSAARTEREAWTVDDEAARRELAQRLAEVKGAIAAAEAQERETGARVAEELAAFEEGFNADLARRREEMEARVREWRETLDSRLAALAADLDSKPGELLDGRARREMDALLARTEEEARAIDERLRSCQADAQSRLEEVRGLARAVEDEWKTGQGEWRTAAAALEQKLTRLNAAALSALEGQEQTVLQAVENMKMEALEAAGARLGEYQEVQEAEWRRLEALAEDSRKLDAELRRDMEETLESARQEFARFNQDAAAARETATLEFGALVEGLRAEMLEAEREFAALKTQSGERVSDQFQAFEENFSRELVRRGEELETKLRDWQKTLDARLAALAAEAETGRRDTEERSAAELKTWLAAQSERLSGELDRLLKDTGAFKATIQEEMDRSREAVLASVQAQEDKFLLRAEKTAAAADERLKTYQEQARSRVAEVQEQAKTFRDEWKAEHEEWDARDKALREERTRSLTEFKQAAAEAEARHTAAAAALEKRFEELHALSVAALEDQEARILKAAEEMKLKTLEAADTRLGEYRAVQDEEWKRLEALAEDSRKLDAELRRDMEETLARARDDFARFERESAETREAVAAGFETSVAGIKTGIRGAEENIDALKTRVEEELAGKLGRFEADFLESLEKRSKDLEGRLGTWRRDLEDRLTQAAETQVKTEVDKLQAAARQDLARTADQVRALEKDLAACAEQVRLVRQAEELKGEMERRVTELRADLDLLDQRRAEAAALEDQFQKIRRLEEDVTAKVTRFSTEKYRIDTMETEFNHLLDVSREVEEKLAHVTDTGDVLQDMEVRLRRFGEGIAAAEEKFQRLEKKGPVLEEATRGIERNFSALQDAEKTLNQMRQELYRLGADKDALQESIDILARENLKAREAADHIADLDTAMTDLTERAEKLQTAREWIAGAENRLEELNREIKRQFTAMEAVVKTRGLPDREKKEEGAPPTAKRDNVVTLSRQGWKVEEIAKSLKISRGEVELILETHRKE